MNWDQVAGNWKQLKGQVKEKWGKLTDDDLDVVAGKSEQRVRQNPGEIWHHQGRGGKGVQEPLEVNELTSASCGPVPGACLGWADQPPRFFKIKGKGGPQNRFCNSAVAKVAA